MKDGNTESTYDLSFDEETIRNLISNIIDDCSIRRNRTSCVEAHSLDHTETKINSARDWKGNKIYENVSDIKQEPVNDPFDYWRIGDPVPFSFTSDELLTPQLVTFLNNILKGRKVDYEWFSNREELTQRQRVQQEVEKLDIQINETSNFETDKKIKLLQFLAIKQDYLNQIPDFNYDTLSNYYDIAENCLNLDLVKTTTTFQKTKPPPKTNN